MTRREFTTVLIMGIPLITSAFKPKHRTVVKIIRSQRSDGTWSEAWSEVKKPNGGEWTNKEIKDNGYRVIERDPAIMVKGKVNK